MSWPLVELGSIANFINGFAFKPAHWEEVGKPIIRIQNLTNSAKPFNYSSMAVPEKYHVTSGDLLVSWSATLDVFEWRGKDALLNQHIFKVEPDFKKIDKDYLRYALRNAISAMLKFTRGSTMKHVNRGDFLGTKIPLPPLEKQKQIAAALEKSDQLRKDCQQMEQDLNSLVQSVFIDMFGDPVTNPKGWGKTTLGNLIEFAKDGPHVSPKYSNDGIPFLSTRHIKSNGVSWTNLKYVSDEEAAVHWKKCKPQQGDVLYTKGGTTGIACPVTFGTEFAVWVHVALLRPLPDKADHIWLSNMLNTQYCYGQSQKKTRGATNKDLGLKRMVDIEMYAPPLKEQRKFSEYLEVVNNQLIELAALQLEYEELFSSLTQKAFKGELNL